MTEIRKQKKPNSMGFKLLSPRPRSASRRPGQASSPGLGARSRPCQGEPAGRGLPPDKPGADKPETLGWEGSLPRARAHNRSL